MLLENKDKCSSHNPKYIFDEACLDIYNFFNETVQLFGQYDECEKCQFQKLLEVEPQNNGTILVNSKYIMQMYSVIDGKKKCEWQQELFEHYRYGWNITEKCSLPYIKQPAENPYLPILSAVIILFFFGTIWYMIKCIYKCARNHDIPRRYTFWNNEVHTDIGGSDRSSLVVEQQPPLRKHPHRIKSLDIFRGLCIMMMIFVNYGGGQYWFFKHSIWNGLTVADLVFPWFLWLMGFSLAVSYNSKLRKAVPRRQLFFQVFRRSCLLVLIGVMINSHNRNSTLGNLRFPGVLQRIGITYFFVGLMETFFAKRSQVDQFNCLAYFQDIIVAWKQWIIIIILLIIHTIVTFVVDVPGCGKGYLGPGGLHDGGKHFNCTGGVAGYIDREVFGEHMYKHPTCQQIYENKVYFDPEGILGILTSIFLVYLGVQAGRTLHTYTDVKAKSIRWVIWGILMALAGGILCEFRKNGGLIPLNKNLWSLSFVLVTGGTAFLIHTYLFVMVDIFRKWGGRPFFYPGMNPLVLYIAHDLFKNTFPFAWTPDQRTHAAYLAMNLWATAIWVAVAIFLYRRNIFISL